jgi:hypothetical protein
MTPRDFSSWPAWRRALALRSGSRPDPRLLAVLDAERRALKMAARLAEAVEQAELQHGGLLTRETLKLALSVRMTLSNLANAEAAVGRAPAPTIDAEAQIEPAN